MHSFIHHPFLYLIMISALRVSSLLCHLTHKKIRFNLESSISHMVEAQWVTQNIVSLIALYLDIRYRYVNVNDRLQSRFYDDNYLTHPFFEPSTSLEENMILVCCQLWRQLILQTMYLSLLGGQGHLGVRNVEQ